MSDPCWFECTATLSDTSDEPAGAGTPVNCVVDLQAPSIQGGARNVTDREAAVGDLVLLALKPGPCHCLSRCNLWGVDERGLAQLGKASSLRSLGGTLP